MLSVMISTGLPRSLLVLNCYTILWCIVSVRGFISAHTNSVALPNSDFH
jgi:hypothetical protein